ncbi:hypothetical protein AGMMS49992_04780 [Clostridia bacterium]|nr:hypothetical protein AGMMS49992_04780 [Clostridia bacterium]
MTCCLALLVYRIIEKRLGTDYTSSQITNTLREMDFLSTDEGYIPTYTRTALTDALHSMVGFRTDRHIITKKKMSHIQKQSKDDRILLKSGLL